MKRTPLYEAHLARGARMVEFGGWEMPVQYTGILEEHRAVRERAGLFDVSHMGDLLVRGEGAEDALRGLLTNDIKGLALGKGIYAHLLNEQGKVLDDTITFHVLPGHYLMVPNASREETIYQWVRERGGGGEVLDLSDRLGCVALQGPASHKVLQKLTSYDLNGLKHFRGDFIDIASPEAGFRDEASRGFLPELLPRDQTIPESSVRCYVTRSGYTGEDGFEILMEGQNAMGIWNALLEAGKEFGIAPCGLGSRDVLRLEMGYLLSGTDFDGSQTSLETGPEWVVKWEHKFIGREALLGQKDCGLFRKLVGLELLERGIPRHGYPITLKGREIGKVTSGTLSPILNRGIALGYVNLNRSQPGEELEIAIRDASVKARVTKPPFIKRGR